MYERLTALLPRLQSEAYGEWVIDTENDGSHEHPIQFPYVGYGPAVKDLMVAIYQFVDEHKEMQLNRYSDILEEANIRWDSASMRDADVSGLDGRTVVALLLGAVRAERFRDGALSGFCTDGCVVKWLRRLEDIDNGSA